MTVPHDSSGLGFDLDRLLAAIDERTQIVPIGHILFESSYMIDVEAIARSVQKTNRAVVLEEGWEICGMGSQVVDFIQRECFDDLDAPVLRVHQEDVPMPYAKNLERAAKPDAAKATAAIKKVMYLD